MIPRYQRIVYWTLVGGILLMLLLLMYGCVRKNQLPASTHPVPAGTAVTDVFLVPLPVVNPSPNSDDGAASTQASPYGHIHMPGDQLAVVNLTKSFADQHPSGIESEDLTLRAIIATLHANLPQVNEVRFVVDGQTRDTLAGHADLTRPYAVADPTHSVHVLSAYGNPM
jgi:hypothetical protein